MQDIRVRVHFDAPIDRVFDAVSDHESFLHSPDGTRTTILRPGAEEPNGLGCLREVRAGRRARYVEEITRWDPPNSFGYTIRESSLPLKHEGSLLTFTPSGEGTIVEWGSRLDVTVPVVGGFLGARAKHTLERAFTSLLVAAKPRVEGPVASMSLRPIGVVRSSRRAIQGDEWDAVTSSVELDRGQFPNEALTGLDTFSHVEVVYWMDRVSPRKIETSSRHPRGNTAWPKVGIFAQRAKNRPNRIGTTVCRIKKVDGLTVHLIGLDAVDGTPVLDIKPWVREFGPRGEVRQPGWMDELMKSYWA
ncbi:MAG TPA: TrmO family methyltransferase [Polyangiaceae bacterium]